MQLSILSTQLNGFKYFYPTQIILFDDNHLFAHIEMFSSIAHTNMVSSIAI